MGKYGSKFFPIAALCTDKPKHIENIMKKVRQRKLKKKLKELNELKANNSDPMIREYVLKRLAKADCVFHIITITKEQIKDYLYEKKHKLYNYILGMVIEDVTLPKEIELTIDKNAVQTIFKAMSTQKYP